MISDFDFFYIEYGKNILFIEYFIDKGVFAACYDIINTLNFTAVLLNFLVSLDTYSIY